MTFARALLISCSVSAFLISTSQVDAAAMAYQSIVCLENYMDVCVGTFMIWSPSIGLPTCPEDFDYEVDSYDLCNNTYVGTYGYSWDFVEGVPDELKNTGNESTVDATPFLSGLSVRIEYGDGEAAPANCTVEINDVACSSCTICEGEGFSSDCTNIESGRMVECESTDPFYYPLEFKSATDEETIADEGTADVPEEDSTDEDAPAKETRSTNSTSTTDENTTTAEEPTPSTTESSPAYAFKSLKRVCIIGALAVAVSVVIA